MTYWLIALHIGTKLMDLSQTSKNKGMGSRRPQRSLNQKFVSSPSLEFNGLFLSTWFCWDLVVFVILCAKATVSHETQCDWWLLRALFIYLFRVVLKYEVSPDSQSWSQKLDQLQILSFCRKMIPPWTWWYAYNVMLLSLWCGQSYMKPFSTVFDILK